MVPVCQCALSRSSSAAVSMALTYSLHMYQSNFFDTFSLICGSIRHNSRGDHHHKEMKSDSAHPLAGNLCLTATLVGKTVATGVPIAEARVLPITVVPMLRATMSLWVPLIKGRWTEPCSVRARGSPRFQRAEPALDLLA
jgi:hypothetical protein